MTHRSKYRVRGVAEQEDTAALQTDRTNDGHHPSNEDPPRSFVDWGSTAWSPTAVTTAVTPPSSGTVTVRAFDHRPSTNKASRDSFVRTGSSKILIKNGEYRRIGNGFSIFPASSTEYIIFPLARALVWFFLLFFRDLFFFLLLLPGGSFRAISSYDDCLFLSFPLSFNLSPLVHLSIWTNSWPCLPANP